MNTTLWRNGNGRVMADGPYKGRVLRKYRDRVWDKAKKDFVPGWCADILMDDGWQRIAEDQDEEKLYEQIAIMFSVECHAG